MNIFSLKRHRKERKMPGGEDSIRGLSVTFTAVTRHHSGHYLCSADNGFGQPSVANIKLDVQRKWIRTLDHQIHCEYLIVTKHNASCKQNGYKLQKILKLMESLLRMSYFSSSTY